MEEFDEDPLDLLEDDGDGVNEMCLFFDKDEKNRSNKKTSHKSGCVVILLATSGSLITAGLAVTKLFA